MTDPSPEALATRDELRRVWDVMQMMFHSTGVDAASPTAFWDDDVAPVIQDVIDRSEKELLQALRTCQAWIELDIHNALDNVEPSAVALAARSAMVRRVLTKFKPLEEDS